ARREGVVYTPSHRERARRRRADDQRRQRPVQHPLRRAAARRHRARLGGRLVPGRVALPARPGARRRPARHLELPRRPQPRPLPAPDREEAQRSRSARVGRSRRGASQGRGARSRVGARPGAGQTPAARAALHAPAVHPAAEAGVPRRAESRPRARDLRPAGILSVRRPDGPARSRVERQPVVDRRWRAGADPIGPRAPAMSGIQQRLATGKGKFTLLYPDLGTAPVSYEDSISPEFFAAEREAVFERSWLYVGRIERLPRPRTYFTRELPGRLASIVVARDQGGAVHAFHNVCAHRGNKVVWQEHPQRETAGACREFACKYHGWRYGLDGRVVHVTNEQEFFDLDKSTLRMPPVHCDVFAGFIFVNLSRDPVPLKTYLGERILELASYTLQPT